LKLNPDIENIDDFKFEDFEVINYQHHPHISAPIAI
jgi:thymidylate synthase